MSAVLKDPNYSWDLLINEVCQKISTTTGNVLTEKQRPMVLSRMKRRLLELRIDSPISYRQYWQANQTEEDSILVGLLTTHFTSFFREFSHFEWIEKELPSLVAQAKAEGRKELRFWSAACSKGQEVWSLCMWLHHHLPKVDPSMHWSVKGTDIDVSSVTEARNGVYHRRELDTAPRYLWEGLWARGKGEIADWYKVKSVLVPHASFDSLNLLDFKLPEKEKFDVILCRNVLIYFDRPNQEKVVRSLLKHLVPHGALITGMSESLTGYGLAIKNVFPSVYKTQNAPTPKAPEKVPETPAMPKPLKVLCVDDSGTVITILKKILVAPDFEVIGTAGNGREAMEKLRTLRPDVITLDIHMPEMDGPTFLKESGVAREIGVVMVTSVGRDDDAMVDPLFDLGVCDFVEKPTLENIKQIAAELGQKLKMAWTVKKKNLNLTASRPAVQKSTKRPPGQIIFNLSFADKIQAYGILKEGSWERDELTLIVHGTSDLERIRKESAEYAGNFKQLTVLASGTPVRISAGEGTVWLQFRGGDPDVVRKYKEKNHILLLEEAASNSEYLRLVSNDFSPSTSFLYLINKYLGGN